ncbi:hypothetical protein [Erwinia tasmaniensis]|uniref:Uncharacterized protein n=1 Tax=Erwinia tasmaniensis (strain DSM 17950 / CFBP 7177 / CIP 109463 / NCPPB 4357 / Et1/99) TaxID=465817 RepID=B2VDN4_ERWT9|nr:hypothetical protein [Erwinia tasmaniensis]CAO97029.1 hypothetical protein ETA_19830 [Erwinia tasmaniensis Et1/99]
MSARETFRELYRECARELNSLSDSCSLTEFMDKKIKFANNMTDNPSSSQKDVEEDRRVEVPNLDDWDLTTEQREFIESMQSDELDSKSDC